MNNNHIVSTLKDYQKKFAEKYKTEVFDKPTNSIDGFPRVYYVQNGNRPRYSFTVYAGQVSVEIAYYPFKNQPYNYEVWLAVYIHDDTTQTKAKRFFARYISPSYGRLWQNLKSLEEILDNAFYSGYDTEEILEGVYRKLPWT